MHAHFLVLFSSLTTREVYGCYIRFVFSKSCPLASKPPSAQASHLPNIIEMASGLPNVDKTQGKIPSGCFFLGVTYSQDIEIPFEHFLSNKNVLHHEKQKEKEKKKSLTNQRKTTANDGTHTQRAVSTFVIPESLATCRFGTVSPMRT